MFDKKTEKKLKEALNQIDPEKLAQVKGMMENSEDLGKLLGRIDIEKAQEKLNELHLSDTVNTSQLSDMINTLKNNPEFIRQLKKK